MDKSEAPEYVYSAASDVCDRIGDHNSKTFDAIVFGIESAILKAKNDALEEAATAAVIHSQYPVENDYDRGYSQARKDAAQAIRNLKHEG